MRFGRIGAPRDIEGSQSAFIDVIFQLVLFFVFSLAFCAEERHLKTYLPKDGGGPGPVVDFLEREVILWLEWQDGETRCSTPKYFPGDGGPPVADYPFPQDGGVRDVALPDGSVRSVTAATIRDRSGRSYRVEHDHGVPDLAAIEGYLAARKRHFGSLGLGAPRVTVHFDPQVPWQDIASVVDACIRSGIDDVALGAPEAER